MANVKIPYALIPAVKLEQRREHMLHAIKRGLPRLEQQPIDQSKTLYIACYGPSLKDTWEELKGKGPIMSMSGSTRFLAERGIIPDYHIDMDPRENKVMSSLPPVPGVTYLVASCTCPTYFDRLIEAGSPVVLWHTVSSNWEDETKFCSVNDPGSMVISTGSTIGLGAIQIGGVMGFNRFEIHGMDGSFAKGSRHAGPHAGRIQRDDITWDALGKTYRTSKIMANAVAETINTAKNFPIITVWHGEGLTQALIRKANLANACCADQEAKRQKLMGLTVQVAQPAKDAQAADGSRFWRELMNYLEPTDLPGLVQNIAICEPLRVKAAYNTGSIPFESAVALRALCRKYQPSTVVEVGTFIGTSTLAFNADRIFTCDRSNDCWPEGMGPGINSFPLRSSTEMLSGFRDSIKVDLFFFDGRIAAEDIAHIVRLSHPETLYVFDDYMEGGKGIANSRILSSVFPTLHLIGPREGRSTLAILGKKETLEQTDKSFMVHRPEAVCV